MKNTIIIDIDTNRTEEPIQIAKPSAADLPKTNEEAKATILRDMACLTEALAYFIRIADHSGMRSIPESVGDVMNRFVQNFPDSGIGFLEEDEDEFPEEPQTDAE